MDEPKNPQPPQFAIVKPGARKGPRSRNRVSRELYEEMAATYLSGTRSMYELAKKFGLSNKTAKKAVETGWPERNWPSLKSRAELHDRIKDDSLNNTDPARAKQARDWMQMREEYMNIAFGVRTAIAQGLAKILPEIKNATANTTRPVRRVHYEEVLDAAGKVVRRVPRTLTEDVVVPPSIFEVMSTINQMAGALERTGGGELEQLLAKPPAAPGKKPHNLKWEHVEYMAVNGGRMPPGVTLDDLGEI